MHLTCHEVGHSFGAAPNLFSRLSLHLQPGKTTAIVGPSGSGKSTLLSILSRSTIPRTGSITFTGIDRVAWVFQNPVGVAARTTLDHVVLPILARGQCDRRKAEAEALCLLAEFGLASIAARPFREISGGEAQRLMLARAVASIPQLLLVDEPTGQLDRSSAATVVEVLGALARDGMIVVIATHDPDVRATCDLIVDLSDYQ
ncbi:ATP-binding cassette domain-containing protein [Micromonospora sp. NPDC049230]|uniref:ATP-binding cassette domain-containing protein n=1 Tax=Micromonospora sp. NPDC049230 TaxID=3155502 RepID=UPI003406AE3A